jgi:glycolate oxidase FAD binding subunit
LNPQDADITDTLAEQVRAASADRRPLRIVGGDTKAWFGRVTEGDRLEMSGHRGVVDYDPCELVVTARAGTPLGEIEALLAENNQTLGFEPPSFGPASTIGGVIAAGLAGPARPFAGAVRDHLLGVRVLDGRGRTLRFGGTVFKNVAGFDAFRLMCGAMGTLGVLLDVSIRVAPAPAESRTLVFDLDWPKAQAMLTKLLRAPYPIDGAFHGGGRLYLRLSGPVDGVTEAARDFDGRLGDPNAWRAMRDCALPLFGANRLWRLSLPRTARLEGLPDPLLFDWAGAQCWVATDAPPERMLGLAASAGGHATLFRGAAPGEDVFTPLPAPLLDLHKRLKAVFDPAGVFNPGRLYEGL